MAQNDPGVLEAEKGLVYYSADIITADLITDTATLKGNVKILFDEYELNASNAFISKKDTTLKAWGDVRLEGNSSYIEADKVDLNYKTREGDLENVRITSGQLLLEAKKVKKISNEVYEATRAKFTTCVTCPPGWRIKGKKIKTNINKYVDITGGRFQILNNTIFPLPHLVLPLNTRRKTGLLFPGFENSIGNSGLEVSQPFFWAIDEHRDLTLSPMIYLNDDFGNSPFEVNGGKLLGEYRQWLGVKSRLDLKAALMYDDTYLDVNDASAPSTRWFLNYKNFFVLPRNIIQKSRFTLLKERTYLNDFTSEVLGRGEAALKNTFSFSKAKKNVFSSAEAVYYINLLVDEPEVSDNFAVHKLPELKRSMIETPFLKNAILFNYGLTYTNFHRNSRSFDEVNTTTTTDPEKRPKEIFQDGASGNFDTTKDLIRTGHRLRLETEASAPFKIGRLFDVRPALSYRDSLYHFNVDKSITVNNDALNPYNQFAYSRYLEFSNSIRTEFSKVYNKQIKHKVVPEVVFRLGTAIDQSDNIFFNQSEDSEPLPYHRQYQAITDEDFFNSSHGVQFDYWDRFFRANVVEFQLTNIIVKKRRQELATYYEQPFFLNLTQSYDFRNQEISATPDPWSNLDGVLKFKSKIFTNFTQFSYFYKAEQTNVTTSNTFIYKPGRYVTVGYSDFLTVDSSGDLTKNRTQNINFSLGWEFPTLKFSGTTNYSLLDKRNLGWRTDISYTPTGNCWGLQLRLLKLNNSDTIGTKLNFNFNFGPNPRTRKSLLTI